MHERDERHSLKDLLEDFNGLRDFEKLNYQSILRRGIAPKMQKHSFEGVEN